MKSFETGSRELERRIGSGRIAAVVRFDTPYAATQHEGDFRHPKGGERKYVENTLKENYRRWFSSVGSQIIRLGPDFALRRVGEDFLGKSQRRAPIEEGTLRASGSMRVE